ncbi:hypothetical protein GYB59_21260 [bacterium]|nr:hypothetical protein [bacterium]
MRDEKTAQERPYSVAPHLSGHVKRAKFGNDGGDDGEACCPAFGYLRGIHDKSTAIEFRFRNGNSAWFPYAWIGPRWYNPSEGLLIKFTGDLVYLVLIRGSNLDVPLVEGSIDLLHAGLQRHRVVWIREMSEEDIAQVGESGPTIDSIDIVEFESNADLKEWVGKTASGFLH